jgi:hypothetical protein
MKPLYGMVEIEAVVAAVAVARTIITTLSKTCHQNN